MSAGALLRDLVATVRMLGDAYVHPSRHWRRVEREAAEELRAYLAGEPR